MQRDRRKALLPYITGGYPDAETTCAILEGIDPARCACVEVGIPFSDPIADGPVIQTSFSRALERGFKLDELFKTLAGRRSSIAVPLLAMVSYSIVYRRDPQVFVERAREAGFDGMIVPDLAIEEADELAAICRQRECPLVMLVAPTSGAARRRRIADISEPFIYYQALAGVTGERSALPTDLVEHLQQLRAETGKPICVGFGISKPEHVQTVCTVADGVIVGSAFVRRMNAAIERDADRGQIVRAVLESVAELTAALPA